MSSTRTAGDRGAGIARRLLGRLGVELHPGEAPTVLALFGTFFFCLCFQYAVKSVRQASWVDNFGAERLPIVYLLVALLTVPLVFFYDRLADRLSPGRLTVLTCGSTAAGLVLFWWLYGLPAQWVPFVFYLWITLVIALNLSQIWAFAARLFDPRQAKRLFAFLGAGALLGGIAGGQLAVLASELAETRTALLGAAAMLLVAAGLVALSEALARPETRRGVAPRPGEPVRALGEVKRSPYLRIIASVFVVSIVVAQVIDLQFNWVVEQATSGLDERTAFFGNFYSVTGIAAVVFQLVLTARIQRGRGVGFSLRLLPATLGAGTIALLVAGGFFPALVLAAGLTLKVGENGLRYSLDQATRELLFLPIPDPLRTKAKAVIDVLVQRGAKGLAAILLLPVVFGWLRPIDAGWLSLALIGLWLVLLPGLYRSYVAAYRQSLERAKADAGLPIDLDDVRTLEVLIQSLGSSDSRQVLHGLELLSSHGRGHLVPPLLLYHDDARVRRETLRVLAATQRDDAVALVERRLRDEDPEVQAAAIRVLAALRHVDAGALMLPRLAEPDPEIRAAAIACVVDLGDEAMAAQAGEALRDMLGDERSSTRIEAARCLGTLSEPAFRDELLQLLYDRDASVVREAVGSIRRRLGRDGACSIYLPTLISLLRDRRLKYEAREALVAFGESAIPALVHFLNDSDEHPWVRRAIPKTLVRIGTPAATAALVEVLARQSDPFLRRKMIEALGSRRPPVPLPQELAGGVVVEIRSEARRYLQLLADRAALAGEDAAGPGLLGRLLQGRLDDSLRNLFGLLALLYPPEPIWTAHRSLTETGSATRGHAVEYLDNTLAGDCRRAVLAAVESQPLEDKLLQAKRLFAVRQRAPAEVVAACLGASAASDADASFLSAAALHAIYTHRLASLYSEASRLAAETADPFVRETAAWVLNRIPSETHAEIE